MSLVPGHDLSVFSGCRELESDSHIRYVIILYSKDHLMWYWAQIWWVDNNFLGHIYSKKGEKKPRVPHRLLWFLLECTAVAPVMMFVLLWVSVWFPLFNWQCWQATGCASHPPNKLKRIVSLWLASHFSRGPGRECSHVFNRQKTQTGSVCCCFCCCCCFLPAHLLTMPH